MKSKYFQEFAKFEYEDSEYHSWKNYFSEIYHDNSLDKTLYVKQAYLIFFNTVILDVINNYINEFQTINHKIQIYELEKLKNDFFPYLSNNTRIKKLKLELNSTLKEIFYNLFDSEDGTDDIFNIFYQEIILPNRRHKLGEFYTPRLLAEKMIEYSYVKGDSVLDPACGTGTFIIEVMRKIEVLSTGEDLKNKLELFLEFHGFEINPISGIIAKLNLIQFILFNIMKKENKNNDLDNNIVEKLQNIIDNIIIGDYLKTSDIHKKFSLIVGNPPWIVINGIFSENYKEFLKTTAKKLDLSTGSQNTSNLELSALFFRYSVDKMLQNRGKIFFVTSAGILNGSQNDKLREFKDLANILVWKFNKDLFNIHNICVYGEKIPKKNDDFSIKVEIKECSDNPIVISDGSIKKFIPSYIKKSNNDENSYNIGRYVEESHKGLYEKEQYYRSEFRQGACLGPRNLIYCDIDYDSTKKIEEKDTKVVIRPDLTINYKKYSVWDFIAYEKAIIEKQFIFLSAKSTDLIPFLVLNLKKIFLPTNIFKKKDYTALYAEAKKQNVVYTPKFEDNIISKDHYNFLNRIFKDNMKSGATITDLLQNINHNNKLFNEKQKLDFKLVYNGIGSIVKSAILRGNIIIDSSLYYYIPNSEEEAYYLMGVLNSPIVTENVKKLGSTGFNGSLRNIHKNPLDIGISEFIGTKLQLKISLLAKEIENFVIEYITSKVLQIFKKLNSDFQICSKCGKLFGKKSIENHITKCKIRNDFTDICRILDENEDNIMKLLLDKEYLKNFFRYPADNGMVTSILKVIIKTRSLQNSLFRDKKYMEYMEKLNSYTSSLLKNDLEN